MSSILDIKLHEGRPVAHQVTEQVRRLILSGAMVPETKLPSMTEIATSLGTNYFTIQSALTPLVNEGLLARRRRHGTVVCHPPTELGAAGIVFGSDVGGHGDEFYRALHAAMQIQGRDAGIKITTWFDSRPKEQQEELLPDLAEALAQRHVQCVIVAMPNPHLLAGLARHAIPIVPYSLSDIPHRVAYDLDGFFALGMAAMAKLGCRTVGMLSNLRHNYKVGYAPALSWRQAFRRAAQNHGLTTRPEWEIARIADSGHLEETGYAAFHRLWAQSSRPQGVIVFPDIFCRGVITAVLTLGVKIPEQLRVVFHVNESVPLFHPFPAVHLIGSPTAMAAALLEQARRVVRDGDAKPVLLPFRAHHQPPMSSQ
jgi:DNA-binding LacI/PurR family transcriptional regulator